MGITFLGLQLLGMLGPIATARDHISKDGIV